MRDTNRIMLIITTAERIALTKTVDPRYIGSVLQLPLERWMLRADKAEVQTVPGTTSIVRTTNKQFHKAVRLESERWFAEPQEAHGDICHAIGGLAGRGDLPKDRDLMRLKSRFHGVGQVASEWRSG